MASVSCPTCGYLLPESANFCPNCGCPRTAVQQRLEEESRRTGVPYIELLERERARAGIAAPSGETLRDVQLRLTQLDETLRRIDERLRRVERDALGVESPPLERQESPPPAAKTPAPVPGRRPAESRHRPAAPSPPPSALTEEAAESKERSTHTRPPSPPPPPPSRPPHPRLTPSMKKPVDIEDLLSGRVLAWAGGLAILIGAIFFLSLAFSRGWIGPSLRVSIGIIAAAGMLIAGAWFFERRERIFGHVMLAVGLGIMNVSLLAATRLYDLIPVPPALLAVLASAGLAAGVAIRGNVQIIAMYGLVAALVAPFMLGAEPTLITAGFVGIVLVGTTAIALYRTWTWLPPIAFLLSAPQVADLLLDDINAAIALLTLAGFWALHAVSAGGEEFRIRRDRLSVTSATLMMLDAAFLVAFGFVVLDGDLERYRGLFLLGVALAHAGLGGYFLRDRGDRHPFGMLAFGTGIAALSMALPIQLGGPPVPIGWAAEAVALAWIYSRRKHIYAGFYALALGALAVAHLALFEYPVDQIAEQIERTPPFLNADGGTLLFFLGALGVAGRFLESRLERIALVITGLALVIYAIPFELSGVAVVAGWSVVALASLGLQRWSVLADDEKTHGYWEALYLPALAAAFLAIFHLLAFDLPLENANLGDLPDVPFTDAGTLAAAILIATAVAASFITRSTAVAAGACISGFAVAAYLMPFQVSHPAMVVAWAALTIGLLILARQFAEHDQAYLTAATVLFTIGLLVTIFAIAPPTRLAVREAATIDHPFFWSAATAALSGLIITVIAAIRLAGGNRQARIWLASLAGALAVYLLSVGVVDEFQRQVIEGGSLDSLQKQAQVALSILWAVLGGGAFVAGVLRFSAAVRLFGLALLGLATAKVFLVDLAALDTSYRVLSFIGLGILLLASSFAYQHYKPRLTPTEDHEPADEAM